jgi:hypothetical protein
MYMHTLDDSLKKLTYSWNIPILSSRLFLALFYSFTTFISFTPFSLRAWSSSDASDSFSASVRFEFRPEHLQSWLKIFDYFPQFLQANAGIAPRISHDRFLSNHSKLNTYYHATFRSCSLASADPLDNPKTEISVHPILLRSFCFLPAAPWPCWGRLRNIPGVRLTTSPPSVSRLSRENMGASTSQNPMGLHGLLQG